MQMPRDQMDRITSQGFVVRERGGARAQMAAAAAAAEKVGARTLRVAEMDARARIAASVAAAGEKGGDILSRVAAVNDALVGSGRVEPSRMNVGFVGEGSAASNVTFAKGDILSTFAAVSFAAVARPAHTLASETGEVKEEAPVSNLRLYEQLELNKAKKEEEFQKKYKANFAPPSALDQDDVVFFEQKEEAERLRLRERKSLDASDHASFLEALANGTKRSQPPPAEPSASILPAPKQQKIDRQASILKAIVRRPSVVPAPSTSSASAAAAADVPAAAPQAAPAPDACSLLCGYSDSDSD